MCGGYAQTLSDPVKRQTYDDWAKQVKYRYIPGVTQKAEGGEDILLDEFDRIGLNCDAASQLVVLCEVRGSPLARSPSHLRRRTLAQASCFTIPWAGLEPTNGT